MKSSFQSVERGEQDKQILDPEIARENVQSAEKQDNGESRETKTKEPYLRFEEVKTTDGIQCARNVVQDVEHTIDVEQMAIMQESEGMIDLQSEK